MNPYIIGGLALLGFMLLSSKGSGMFRNPFSPNQAPPSAGGPLAAPNAAVSQYPAGFTPLGSGQSGQSPNATLQTVNNGVIVANNALGLFDKIAEFFQPEQDEYAVEQYDRPGTPNSAAPSITNYTDVTVSESSFWA